MTELFDFEKALKAVQSGQAISGKGGVLAPLLKQLTEAALEAELESHIADDVVPNRKNGKSIYQICHKTGIEGAVEAFPSPDALWNKTFAELNEWLERFNAVPFEDLNGTKQARYYQELAVNSVMGAIANEKKRVLLTLATGTGKTFIAFQIAWKLFKSKWNKQKDGKRAPRILFLADRNILANQAYLDFGAFNDDALRWSHFIGQFGSQVKVYS